MLQETCCLLLPFYTFEDTPGTRALTTIAIRQR
jgi:hypothetical protein